MEKTMLSNVKTPGHFRNDEPWRIVLYSGEMLIFRLVSLLTQAINRQMNL